MVKDNLVIKPVQGGRDLLNSTRTTIIQSRGQEKNVKYCVKLTQKCKEKSCSATHLLNSTILKAFPKMFSPK